MSLVTQVSNLATAAGTQIKELRTRVGALTSLTTTDKTSIVAAVNEVKAAAGSGATIDDATTATTTAWSSSKTNTSIGTQVAAVVNAAPAALDTLNELATALGNDANYAATTTSALGNRVRVDAAQAFTGAQKTQGRSNIDSASSTDVGDTTTDFVAAFNAALL